MINDRSEPGEADYKMLCKCLEAFRAMATADAANLFLRQQAKQKRETYAGTGQHKLRRHMMEHLEQHLGIGK